MPTLFPAFRVLIVMVALAVPAPLAAQTEAADEFLFTTQPIQADGRSLLRTVADDMRSFVTSPATYLTLGIGVGLSTSLYPYDSRIASSRLNGELFQPSRLADTFEFGEVLGGGGIQVGGALVAFGVGRLLDSPGLAAVGRDLVRAQLLNGIVTHALKRSVGRRRPDGASRRSFPSGHSSAAFATAAVLQSHYGWKAGVPALGLAAYVAGSRLSENRHYLSDVVFGAAVGIAAGRAVTVRLGDLSFDVTPMATPGGAGVQLSAVGF